MRQIIDINDIKSVIGRWIVMVNGDEDDPDLSKTQNAGFWLEKRISFVGILYGHDGSPHIKCKRGEQYIILNGIYYCHGIRTPEEFVTWFNEAGPTYTKEGSRPRHHRFLTDKELDWLNEELKKEK